MLKTLLIPAVLLACTGLSLAQTGATQPEKKTEEPAPKTVAPAKPKAPAPDATLHVGDAAPSISIDKWIKGEPVTGFEKGRVYVVEFWATWCGPCLKSIPHLTKLQKDNKDITIIGVASSERKDKGDADNRLTKLESFVEKKGDDMAYTIAYDSDRQMAEAWLKAAGKNTIPTAFIVNGEGKVAWIGNPLDPGFDAELDKAMGRAPSKKAKEATTDAKPVKKETEPTKKEAPAKNDKKK